MSYKYGHFNIVKLLIKNGADVDDSSLVNALMKNHDKIIKYLVKNCADIHANYNHMIKRTIYHKKINSFKYQFENYIKPIHFNTLLDISVGFNNFAISKYLIERKTISSESIYEYISIAAKNKNMDLIKLLVNKSDS